METAAKTRNYWLLLLLGGVVTAIGVGAAYYMEEHGHIVTGMNNQVVWGLPHVFAIFLIVAASGVLNVASIGSVFGQPMYKPRARLSGLLCLAMLAGGLLGMAFNVIFTILCAPFCGAFQVMIPLGLVGMPLGMAVAMAQAAGTAMRRPRKVEPKAMMTEFEKCRE